MKNELDRNESELEYYESMVNDLATRCEDLLIEKQNLESDLDVYIHEKEDLVQANITLTQQLQSLSADHVTQTEQLKDQWTKDTQGYQQQIEELRKSLLVNAEVCIHVLTYRLSYLSTLSLYLTNLRLNRITKPRSSHSSQTYSPKTSPYHPALRNPTAYRPYWTHRALR